MKDIFPPMHTAEHILNQTMARLFKTGRSFSAHIEKKKSKCDYWHDRNIGSDEISRLEAAVNEVIRAALEVREHYVNYQDAVRDYQVSHINEQPEKIRIVHIGDYDSVPCSGPHVKNTSELGLFRIISTSFDKGVLRVRYRLV